MTKKISLSELHEWIVSTLEVRDLYSDKDPERNELLDTCVKDQLILIGGEGDNVEEVNEVQQKFRDIIDAIGDLDCLFHDKFDCR